jgi:hypothetical protein
LKSLLNLKYDKDTNFIDIESLFEKFPETPFDVLQYLYSEHGRSEEIQGEYGNINLDEIVWRSELWTANMYQRVSVIPDNKSSVKENIDKGILAAENDWKTVGVLQNTLNFWKDNNSWASPPFLLSPTVSPDSRNRLAEGHSRLGFLIGLLKRNAINKNALLPCYVARTLREVQIIES